MADWYPIATAPKDRLVLLADNKWPLEHVPVKVGTWYPERERWLIFGASWSPTHWMELPEGPAKEESSVRTFPRKVTGG